MTPSGSPSSVVVRIVKELEEHGLDRRGYCLYHSIDPDVLEKVVDSGNPAIQIEFPVDGYHVTLTGDGQITVDDR